MLPYVEQFVEALGGKTVITSDLGNSFGEFSVYSHFPRTYIPPLVRVLWLELPFEVRKTVEYIGGRVQRFRWALGLTSKLRLDKLTPWG